jgi:dihydrodipicolinate synthase/N-acetylneuraminate lyase
MNELRRKELMEKLVGPVVPLNIPYKENLEIDYDSLGRYVDFLAREKVPTIILTFGSSEYINLTDDEIYEVTKTVGEANAGRSMFVGATKCWTVKKSIEYIEHAKKFGAGAVKIQPQYYYNDRPFDQECILKYYKDIDKRSNLPLWAYSAPLYGAHSGLSNETWGSIASECSNVYAMKTDGDMMYGYYGLINASKDRAVVVSAGQMKTMFFGWPFGSRSYLCTITFFMPKVGLYFIDCMIKRKLQEAEKIIHAFEDKMINACSTVRWLLLAKSMVVEAGYYKNAFTRQLSPQITQEQKEFTKKLYNEFQETAIDFGII